MFVTMVQEPLLVNGPENSHSGKGIARERHFPHTERRVYSVRAVARSELLCQVLVSRATTNFVE